MSLLKSMSINLLEERVKINSESSKILFPVDKQTLSLMQEVRKQLSEINKKSDDLLVIISKQQNAIKYVVVSPGDQISKKTQINKVAPGSNR